METNEQLLDNPIWNALYLRQQAYSLGGDFARRFLPEIGPLAGLLDQSQEAYSELATLAPRGEVLALFLEAEPRPGTNWRLVAREQIEQMIFGQAPALPQHSSKACWPVSDLALPDVPEMLALTALTEPGPFRSRTWELGGFVGLRIDGRLAAMAGQRLALPGFTEISAVCTHPDFRGMGLAAALMVAVATRIRERGETPFLTVRQTNTSAIRVYQAVGFAIRRTLHLAMVAYG
jgi:GNAT superfamily N-acetyltransferase